MAGDGKERFWTGLVHLGGDGFERSRCRGAGWEAVLDQPPSDQESPGHLGIFLLARRWQTAQRALELIWAAYRILETLPGTLQSFPHVALGDGTPVLDSEGFPVGGMMRADGWGCGASGFLDASLLAARASRRRDWAYSISLLAFSQNLVGCHYLEFDPSHWRYEPAVSEFPADHVRLAYAIVAAYAAIEQLGLDVRASSERPSRTGPQWNCAVREDLEQRLRAQGVNLDETLLWTVRGPARRVDRDRPTSPVSTAPWAWGPIRDQEVDVVDAIADVSWLRSKVASHRMMDLATSLTRYDVSNAQHLARRLLLESLGWRRYEQSALE